MCVRNSLSSGIHAAAFYYYKARPQPITAAIWFRFASPKFLLHCVPQKLHIAAGRYWQGLDLAGW